jgi:hypothetical protein
LPQIGPDAVKINRPYGVQFVVRGTLALNAKQNAKQGLEGQ